MSSKLDWEGVEKAILSKASKALDDVANHYHGNILQLFEGTASPEDLAALDHPYATRHGVHGGDVPNQPWYTINKQTGKLVGGVGYSTMDGDEYVAKVTFSMGITKYASYVLDGTRKMIQRNPFEEELITHLGYYSQLFGNALAST